MAGHSKHVENSEPKFTNKSHALKIIDIKYVHTTKVDFSSQKVKKIQTTHLPLRYLIAVHPQW
jgi:hypothetical protein